MMRTFQAQLGASGALGEILVGEVCVIFYRACWFGDLVATGYLTDGGEHAKECAERVDFVIGAQHVLLVHCKGEAPAERYS